MEQCLYHTQSNNIVGYCELHHCGLTTKQMRGRACLQKQCWHFQKNETHPFWKQRELQKNKRIERKLNIDEYVKKIKGVPVNE